MRAIRYFLFFCYFFLLSNACAHGSKALTLDEAILLAVRQNPNIQSSRLDLVSQKFSLWVQEWQFLPHYSLQADATLGRNHNPINGWKGSHNYSVSPGMTWTSPIGTELSLTSTNVDTNHFNPGLALQFTQPLMRGFGTAIVETALHNAQESLQIQKLSIEGTLRTTVTNVINAYLDVIYAEKRLHIDEKALQRAEKSVSDTKLFIKAGRKAGNDLVTVQANVASAKSTLESDKNNLLQTRYALLTAIGLDPNADVHFADLDLDRIIAKYHIPPLPLTKQLTLENDVNYQTQEIMLYGSKARALMVAKDNARWQLNIHGSVSTGGASGGGAAAGFNSIFNGAYQGQTIGIKLDIPIDNQQLKQSVLDAKIALKQAALAQKQKRWSVETSAINGWNSVNATLRALHYAEDAEQLQERTYNLSYQKYLHGLIDSLELQSAQFSLIQEQQNLLRSRIDYLKALVNLDQTIGHSLKTWNIQVRL